MPDIRLVQTVASTAISIEWLLTPAGPDETMALATAVILAFGTDRLAEASDDLPLPGSTDRRGWWGDMDAETIWNGWPIGSRLWLMTREKVTDANARQGATVARASGFLSECLQPFVDAQIASDFEADVVQSSPTGIDAVVFLDRGPLPDIALQFQGLWNELTDAPITAALPPLPPALDFSDPANSQYAGAGG